MKEIIRLAFFLTLVISFSCEKMDLVVNCSECTPEEPQSARLSIKLEYIGENVVVKIYEGELEDNILKASFNTISPEMYHSVSLNKKYTVTATYILGGRTYIAVDSATPGVKYVKDQCDDPCYYVYGTTVNLQLKYISN